MSGAYTSCGGLMVFCEGAHDIAFVRQVLKYYFGFEIMEKTFSEYPSPFHLLFPRNIQKHVGQDLALDMAHKFYLPNKVLVRSDFFVMLFEAGGGFKRSKAEKDKTEHKVYTLLKDLLPLMENAADIRENASMVMAHPRYLFLADVDDLGVEKVRNQLLKGFQKIEGEDWLTGAWVEDEQDSFGAVAGHIGSYLWGETRERGTLEDLVFPLMSKITHADVSVLAKALAAVDDLFPWAPNVADQAKQKKAAITLAGQRAKPGGSQSVILDQGLDLTKDANKKKTANKNRHRQLYLDDRRVQSFADFLSRFTGLETVQGVSDRKK